MRAISHSTPEVLRSKESANEHSLAASWLLGWDALGCEWTSLSARTKPFSPFCEWPWMAAWWKVCGEEREIRTLAISDKGRIVALFPMTLPKSWTPFALRRLVPFAYGGHFEFNGLTEEPIWRCEHGYEALAWDAALDALREVVKSGESECAILRRLTRSPSRSGPHTKNGILEHQKFKPGPNVVGLPKEWPAYRSRLTRSMRDNFAYYPKLVQRQGHRSETVIIGSDELDTAATEVVRLHRLRAATDPLHRHMDYFSDPRSAAMLRTGISAMATLGKAFVALLIIDGGVAAAQAFLETDNTLLVHYSGFDPDWAKFSPLFILQSDVIRGAIERGVNRLDLLPGKNLWQSRWGAKSEEWLERRLFVSLRPISLLRAALYGLRRQAKSMWLRSRLARRIRGDS
jgi:CelD/BcsL family acetyltransferase involved in cellulose biosynthesis